MRGRAVVISLCIASRGHIPSYLRLHPARPPRAETRRPCNGPWGPAASRPFQCPGGSPLSKDLRDVFRQLVYDHLDIAVMQAGNWSTPAMLARYNKWLAASAATWRNTMPAGRPPGVRRALGPHRAVLARSPRPGRAEPNHRLLLCCPPRIALHGWVPGRTWCDRDAGDDLSLHPGLTPEAIGEWACDRMKDA